ncbi:MAG: (2Fe-2S)-binding protein, partial [Burkholderiales bacterium]|nr:(2Fe-2S)-binding protein [Burkholderiales bacterium]
RGLLAPGALLGLDVPPPSPQVCTCFDVREDRILATLQPLTGSPEARLVGLQSALKCGTNCGSCLPTLRRLVAAR